MAELSNCRRTPLLQPRQWGRGVFESTCLAVDCIGFMSWYHGCLTLGKLIDLSEPQFPPSVK